MRVCVVGAGFAGLACADALCRCGHEVVVLEARGRVGGRVHSDQWDDGTVIERGAEFIEAGQEFVIGYAEALGLDLVVRDADYGRRRIAGAAGVTAADLDSALLAADALLPVSIDEGLSLTEALARVPIPDGIARAIAVRIQVTNACDADRLEVAAIGGSYRAYFDGDPGRSVSGGNQLIARRLAERLAVPVALSSPVRAISWTPSGAVVATDANEITCERVVVTVPASVIDLIDFRPALPAEKADALAAVGYGHAAKMFVPLAAPAPNAGVLSVPRSYWSWTANGADGQPAPVAHCFAGSPSALEGLDVDGGPDRWLADLKGVLRPELDWSDDGDPLLVNWDDDPWVGCAYSCGANVTSEKAHAALTAAVGPIEFAGEHTAGESHALMDGALRSGIAAAMRIDPGACTPFAQAAADGPGR